MQLLRKCPNSSELNKSSLTLYKYITKPYRRLTMLDQRFPTFSGARLPTKLWRYLAAPLYEEIELLLYKMWNLATPLAASHGTLVYCGTPVGNHCVRQCSAYWNLQWFLYCDNYLFSSALQKSLVFSLVYNSIY